jgi:hypothetical protein
MSLWKDNTVTKPAPTPMPSVTPPTPTFDKEPTRMETAATPKVEPISSHPRTGRGSTRRGCGTREGVADRL